MLAKIFNDKGDIIEREICRFKEGFDRTDGNILLRTLTLIETLDQTDNPDSSDEKRDIFFNECGKLIPNFINNVSKIEIINNEEIISTFNNYLKIRDINITYNENSKVFEGYISFVE